MYLYFNELPVHTVKTQGGPFQCPVLYGNRKLHNHDLKFYTHKYLRGKVKYNESGKDVSLLIKEQTKLLICGPVLPIFFG